jgi:hypothetical protein
MKISPRFFSRDLADFAISSVIGVFQSMILLGLLPLLTLLLTESVGASLGIFFVIYGIVLLFTVRCIHVSEEGIIFARALGCPRRLAWAKIRDISPVSRKELILRLSSLRSTDRALARVARAAGVELLV